MIENKLVSIVKQNTFNLGWALFKKHALFPCEVNDDFREYRITDAVRKITMCSRVDIILAEPCLPSAILEEIEWVSKFAEVNIIVSDERVKQRYGGIKFNSVKVDAGVDFNYLYLNTACEEPLSLVLDDFVLETDDTAEKLYFKSEKGGADFSFLDGASNVLIIDGNYSDRYDALLSECAKRKIPAEYAVSVKAFNQSIFGGLAQKNCPICTFTWGNNCVLLFKDDKIFCAKAVKDGSFITYPAESVRYFIKGIYSNLDLKDILTGDEIPKESYIVNRGEIKPLKIAQRTVVERTVKIVDMQDFIAENFDKSETEKHNDYCAEAREVEYKFTLIPPLNGGLSISSIYDGGLAIYKRWRNLQNYGADKTLARLCGISDNPNGLTNLCNECINADNRLKSAFEKYDFNGYYSSVDRHICAVESGISSLADECGKIHEELDSVSAGDRFAKIDGDIAYYKKLISEKKALIARGEEVLQSKQRVNSLESQLRSLEEKRQRFGSAESIRASKSAREFTEKCDKLLKGEALPAVQKDGAIEGVLGIKNSKTDMLNVFAETALCAFRDYLAECVKILREFKEISVPENYVVYEQNGRRVIVIDALEEFEKTADIRKKFGLHCIARR